MKSWVGPLVFLVSCHLQLYNWLWGLCWQLLVLLFLNQRGQTKPSVPVCTWDACLRVGVFPVKERDPLSLSLIGWAWGPALVPRRGHLTALGLAVGWDGAALWRLPRLKAQTLRVTLGLWVPNKCKVLNCQGIHCTWLWVIPPSSQQRFAKHLSADLGSRGS